MKKLFSVILVFGLVLGLGIYGYTQDAREMQVIDKDGEKIIKIPGASEDFIGEGFRSLDEKQEKLLDYFESMVSTGFTQMVFSEIENLGMVEETYWGIRGMSSKKLAILLHSFKVGIATDTKNHTGKIIKSELVFVYYFDDLQSAPKTGEGSLAQIAESVVRKVVDDIKEKISLKK